MNTKKLIFVILLTGIATVAIAQPVTGDPIAQETSPLIKIIDYIMENFGGLLISLLIGAGIGVGLIAAMARQIGEFLLAFGEWLDREGSWTDVREEFMDIVKLIKNRKVTDTIKATKKSKAKKIGLLQKIESLKKRHG